MSKKGTVGKILAGAAIGVGLGALFAPKKGSDTRKSIKEKAGQLVNKIKRTNKKDKEIETEE